ncbi:hypothetical protein A1O3_02986 [Capronia epimyces CBS 606.96]|uniref:AMP-activated protein kinase glycogen-binding domain-containing protein n=1 Tax=Capronia epimyces CBS 606.96 TaxID=1182542 RepID=W9Z607_9EURO|nr:uncharacterized protein A1O3_02986 [Capronia epimyces CBS 606.96]EXJ89919.1 hypothetical protein A1O3_02986 [Capronia epimyces CBS 606.96]
MGSFVFRWPHPNASDVHVTGTFDNWGKSEKLNKVGDVWEKDVELSQADNKILYKFVVDDKWVIDPEAPQEDDGHGNINNVLYPDRIRPKPAVVPEAFTTSSAAPESTTTALAGQVPLEPRKEATEVTSGTDDSTLTKETTKSSLPGAFPETPQHEEPKNETETITVNPIPATSGTGNPISLPAGEQVPPPSEVTSNTVHSTVTTSKEDYEKSGSASLPFVAGVAGLGAGLAGALGFGASEKKENLIPESSLPIGPAAGETLDAGPTISSAGPISTTAELAGKVPLEERKPATVVEPESTVPEVVKESIEEAHAPAEATAFTEAVQEKAEVEKELLKKIPTAEEAGEPAPTIAASTSATAPSSGTPAATTSLTDGAEDPTLASEPAVQLMAQNEAEDKGVAAPPTTEATPEAPSTTEPAPATAATPASPAAEKKAAPAPATPSSAKSTPTKKADTTPTSSPTTKEKKKKHRISSLFKKIFD